jgi:hypothetical protein
MHQTIRPTGIRYYENDDTIVFTALKVASRYLDSLFYDDDLSKVKELYYNEDPLDSELYFKHSEVAQNANARIDKTLNNIYHGKCRKKLIFLCRHPLKRHVASINHFFENYVKVCMMQKLKKRNYNSILDDEFDKNTIDYYDYITSNKNMWINEKSFNVLKNIGTWPVNSVFKMRIIPTNAVDVLTKMAIKFIKTESSSNWDNTHYAPYLKTYDYIINPKNIKNVRIVDIDKENISNIFNTKKSKVGVSTQWTKLIIEELIKSSKIDLIDSEVIIYNKLMKL